MSIVNITINNFEEEVLNSDKTVLLDFWATWCGPCMMIAPIVHEIAEENTHIKVGKIDVDENPQLAAKFGIISIPTLIVIKNGEIVKKSEGLIPKEQILALLQ
jgi:thioredoxin 1